MTESEESKREYRLCQYLDGQLGRSGRRKLDKQLQDDPHLREELDRYAALDSMLAELGRDELAGVDWDQQRAEIVSAVEKRALLNPARRRAVVLRPVFGAAVAAAAAAVALVVGTVVLLRGPGVRQAQGPAVSVRVLPAQPQGAAEAVVSVQFQPPRLEEMPLAPQPAALTGGAPAGTVVVSVGPLPPGDSTLADAMVAF